MFFLDSQQTHCSPGPYLDIVLEIYQLNYEVHEDRSWVVSTFVYQDNAWHTGVFNEDFPNK